MTESAPHPWAFKARFRRRAFGWRGSRPAMKRIKEAVSEIHKVRRRDPGGPVLAAEGAVVFLERVSPALEQVDTSSGALGTAVHRAIEQLVAVIAQAPATAADRRGWLDRLLEALQADRVPYLEQLGDFWGELAVTRELASEQADRMLGPTRRMLAPDKPPGERYSGTSGISACLSALYKAERYEELIEVAGGEHVYWAWRRWAVRAVAAQGRTEDALEMAESSRGPWASDLDIDQLGEDILRSSGRVEEAYERYGLTAHRAGTYLATFRAVARHYPAKAPETILSDLVATTPGEEGKWFAAAKSVGLLDDALELARRSPSDPKTLTRAARDFADENPRFALEAGGLALHWLAQGYGYEMTAADVWAAYDATVAAARTLGELDAVRGRIRDLIATCPDGFVTEILERALRQP